MKKDLTGVIKGLQIVTGLAALAIIVVIGLSLVRSGFQPAQLPLIGLLTVNVLALGLSVRAMRQQTANAQRRAAQARDESGV